MPRVFAHEHASLFGCMKHFDRFLFVLFCQTLKPLDLLIELGVCVLVCPSLGAVRGR